MQPVHRPAVRVLCFDAAHRLLLLHWRDPASGGEVWEPPGGGIDPGETPPAAARRELTEETGLDPTTISEHWHDVQRSFVWNGTHFAGTEQFFTATFTTDRPPLARAGLMPDEQLNLLGHRWATPAELPAPLEPPDLAAIVAELAPPGPWTAPPQE